MIKIKIDGINQDKVEFGTKITFMSGKDKYSFFNTKKDGSNTKAFEQFKKFGFQIGDTVEAEVKEEDKSFINKEGKNVSYKQRTIIFFNEIENMPMVTNSPKAEPSDLEARVKKLEDAVFAPIFVVDDNIDLYKDIPEEQKGITAEQIPF